MNVLITSVGRRSYIVRYFRNALRGDGSVIAANSVAHTPGLCEADEALVVPASNAPDYIETIEQVCREKKIGLLCSLHDLDVFILSQYQDRLRHLGVIPVLPSPEWGRLCLDKHACGLRLESCGCSVPWTSLSLEETKAALTTGRLRFPLVVKARFGFGSLGLRRCRNLAELDAGYQDAREEIARSVVQRFCAASAEAAIIIQETVEGPEYCVDIVNDLEGNYVTHFACQVHGMRAGESEAATTVDAAFAGQLARRLSETTRHPGVWGVDLMMHNGVPKVIDINPRFTGDYPFQHIAGADIPSALIAWARGREIDARWISPKVGIRGYKDLVPVQVRAIQSAGQLGVGSVREGGFEPEVHSR